jgi:hypothetical protein
VVIGSGVRGLIPTADLRTPYPIRRSPMLIRQSLWSFEERLRDEIAREVSRKASKRQLGPTFRSVSVAHHDDGPVLNFVFLGSDRHSARRDSWALIRDIAADVYARTSVRSE